jgi:uncharacterized membrane protein
MSDDNNSRSGDPATTRLFNGMAIAFATAGAIALTNGSLLGIAAIAVAIVLYILERNWSRITTRASNQFVQIVHNIARHRNVVLSLIVVGFGVYAARFVYNIRSDLDTYVMPRRITPKQADDLREYLSHHDKYAVTVKVNPLDAEAREYGAQLMNALNRSDWTATFDTSGNDVNTAPNTLNDGLCIDVMGENTKPYDVKHDPKTLLQEAFTAADIVANCGGGVGQGQYKLFVVVGHRPLSYGYRPPALARLGRWIMSLSQ